MLLDENIKPDIQSAPLLVGFNHGFSEGQVDKKLSYLLP